MSFISTFVNPIGKIGRLQYWVGILFLFIVFFYIFIISNVQDYLIQHNMGAMRVLIVLVLIIQLLIIITKRLRDAGKSPWLSVLIFLPGINLIAILFFGMITEKT